MGKEKDARIRLNREELELVIKGLRKVVGRPKEFGPHTEGQLLLNRLCRYAAHGITGRTASIGLIYTKMEKDEKR